jgi:hypothetical protein
MVASNYDATIYIQNLFYVFVSNYSAASSALGASAGATSAAGAAVLLRERRVRPAFLAVFSLSMFSL